MKKILIALMLMSMAVPSFAMGKGKGKKQRQSLDVSFTELESNEDFVLFLDARTRYNLNLTDLPEDVRRLRLRKPKGQSKKELKFNSRRRKVNNGVAKNSLVTGRAQSPFLGSVDLVAFSDSSDLDDDSSSVNDDANSTDDDASSTDQVSARLVASDDEDIKVVIKQADVVCTDDFTPVCGRLTFPDDDSSSTENDDDVSELDVIDDDSTSDIVELTFSNECDMERSGATKVSDGECP